MQIGDVIWKCKVNNKYDCFVERNSEDTGQLKVIDLDNNILLLNTEVDLIYKAEISPDYEDVMLWQEMCEKVFDKN